MVKKDKASSTRNSDPVPLAVPCLRGNEWSYLEECLDTNWVSSVGSFVDRFEAAVAQYVGARHGVATVNGTAALHVALMLAGVRAGDEVIVSDLTFIAPANAIRYVGAWPVFIDAEPRHWQMDVAKLAEFLSEECEATGEGLRNRHTGRPVRAIVPVHILGHPCDLTPILALADRYRLRVIEDASESLGASYQGRRVGRPAHLACFSFNGNKIITTGGGGMLVTDDDDLASRARYLTTQAKDDPIEFIHNEVGYNYRLTNIQAALGCAQMECLDSFVDEKRAIAARYSDALAGVAGITVPIEAPAVQSSCWLYTILVDEERYGMSSRALMARLAEESIQSRPLWQPLHLSPAHAEAWYTDCSVAEGLNRRALSLPCSVGMQPEHQRRVIEIIRGASRRGQR